MVAKVAISEGQRPGSLFVPMHWNNQFARQGRVNKPAGAAVTDPYSGQPESKQAAVAIAAWQPAWHSELFLPRTALPFPAAWHWRRRAAPGVLYYYSLAGEASARQWLSVWRPARLASASRWLTAARCGTCWPGIRKADARLVEAMRASRRWIAHG